MRKLILLTTFIVFSISSFAQRNNNEWFLSIGLNSVNSLGAKSPVYHPDQWISQFPISAALELNWTGNFAIEQSITLNAFIEGDTIDGVVLTKDYNYLSLDTHVKYYFGEYLFNRIDWIDLYANAGLGFFHIEDTNISANLGGGVLFWLNNNRSFGLRAQAIAKFAFNHSESGLDNNHFQYHLQAIFKL